MVPAVNVKLNVKEFRIDVGTQFLYITYLVICSQQ